MKQRNILAIIILAILIGLGLTVYALNYFDSPSQSVNTPTSHNKPVVLTIDLKDGKPVAPPSIYLVRQNTHVEFKINSDTYGKIGAPVSPPQTIDFTQSPLVFNFTANKIGTYPITYQASGSKTVIEIGSVQVRNQ